MFGFRIVRTLKICQTSWPDVMSGRALLSRTFSETQIFMNRMSCFENTSVFMRRSFGKGNFEKKFAMLASPALYPTFISSWFIELIFLLHSHPNTWAYFDIKLNLFSQFDMIFNRKSNFGFGLPMTKSKNSNKSRIKNTFPQTLFSNMVYRLWIKLALIPHFSSVLPNPSNHIFVLFLKAEKKAKDMRWLTSLILSWRFCFSKESCLVGPQSNLGYGIFIYGIYLCTLHSMQPLLGLNGRFNDSMATMPKSLQRTLGNSYGAGIEIWAEFGSVCLLKKRHLGRLWAPFEAGFFKFLWTKKEIKNIVAFTLKSCIKRS